MCPKHDICANGNTVGRLNELPQCGKCDKVACFWNDTDARCETHRAGYDGDMPYMGWLSTARTEVVSFDYSVQVKEYLE